LLSLLFIPPPFPRLRFEYALGYSIVIAPVPLSSPAKTWVVPSLALFSVVTTHQFETDHHANASPVALRFTLFCPPTFFPPPFALFLHRMDRGNIEDGRNGLPHVASNAFPPLFSPFFFPFPFFSLPRLFPPSVPTKSSSYGRLSYSRRSYSSGPFQLPFASTPLSCPMFCVRFSFFSCSCQCNFSHDYKDHRQIGMCFPFFFFVSPFFPPRLCRAFPHLSPTDS